VSILLASLTACGQGQFANPFIVPFTLTATPNPLSLPVGKSARVAITATGDDAPVTNLSLKVLEAPRELTVTTSGSSLQIQAAQDAPPGLYPVVVKGSTAGGNGESVIQVNVTAPVIVPLVLTATPNPVPLTIGKTARVIVTATSGNSVPVTNLNLKVLEVPKELTVSTSGSSLQIQAAPGTLPGVYPITIEGSTTTGQGQSVILVNVSAESIPGFKAVFKPSEVKLDAGKNVRVALQITRDANYTGEPVITQIKSVSYQITVFKDGDGLILIAGRNVTAGVYVVTVVVSDGTVSQEVSLNVTVTAATEE